MNTLKAEIDRRQFRNLVLIHTGTLFASFALMLISALAAFARSEIPFRNVIYFISFVVFCAVVSMLLAYRRYKRLTFEMNVREIAGETFLGKKIAIPWRNVLHVDPIKDDGYRIVGSFQSYAIHDFDVYSNKEELLDRLAKSLPVGTRMPDSLRDRLIQIEVGTSVSV